MHAFCRQAYAAHRRGIEFSFTFDEWVKWWVANLGPFWFQRRGRGWKQYCMARVGDSGPYSPENTKCITNEENSKDRSINRCFLYGEQVNTAKLTTDKVKVIFLSKTPIATLARKYGVGYGTIRDVKTGYRWSHVTQNLTTPPRRKRPILLTEGGVSWHGS